MELVFFPASFLEVPAGSLSEIFVVDLGINNVNVTGTWSQPPNWSMTSLIARFCNIPCGHGMVKGGNLLAGSRVVGWLVTWFIDKEKLIVYQPVPYLNASGARVFVGE